jgi:predicted nucleic acid-binding protein
MVLMTPGCLVITTDPQQQAVLKAITELQLRQDETKQDFTDAIQVLLARLVT